MTLQATSDIRSTAAFAINAGTNIKLLPENSEQKAMVKVLVRLPKGGSIQNP